jgi:hypothetical protein
MSASKIHTSCNDCLSQYLKDMITDITKHSCISVLRKKLEAENYTLLTSYTIALDQTLAKKSNPFGRCSFVRCPQCAKDAKKCAECGHTYGKLFNQTVELMKVVFEKFIVGNFQKVDEAVDIIISNAMRFNIDYWGFIVKLSYFAEELLKIATRNSCTYQPEFKYIINDVEHMPELVLVEDTIDNPKLLDCYIQTSFPGENKNDVCSKLYYHNACNADDLKNIRDGYLSECEKLDTQIALNDIAHLIYEIENDLKKAFDEQKNDFTKFVHLARIDLLVWKIFKTYLHRRDLI